MPVSISNFIDTSADPCADFFKYACGNFTKFYPIPNDRSAFGTGALVAEQRKDLHTMLEKAAAGGEGRTPNEQKIGDYYAACMDVDAINQKGLEPLQPDLDRIAALKDKSELTSLLAHFQLINVNAFLGFGEQQDFKDATKQIAVVDQGGLGLPERDYYFRTGDAAEKTRKAVCAAHHEHAEADGRAGESGCQRRPEHHATGDRVGQGLHGHHVPA